MGWNVKDSVQNLFDEGVYDFRLESVGHGMSKNENSPNPVLKWKWVNVSNGDFEGKPAFQTFTLRADVIGILGSALAATQQFGVEGNGDEDLPPEDLNNIKTGEVEELAKIIEQRCGGRVFEVKYGHRLDKATKRVWPQIDIIGPSNGGAFK